MSENNGLVVAHGQKDVDELSWVADVLEEGAVSALTTYELLDLAGVIRSKLPKPEPKMLSSEYTVTDLHGSEYKNFDGKWYLVDGDYALEVPYESIQIAQPKTWVVVE